MFKKYANATVSLWICFTFVAMSPASADTTLDNFESYSDGRVIGPSATSTPWRRFGGATNDNIVATSRDSWLISGDFSALYGLVWPSSFGAVRYVFDEPTDLSHCDAVTVKIRSNKADAYTRVQLAISNGQTTFMASVDYAVTQQPELLTFRLGSSQMIRTVGEDNYEEVIGGVWNIGFDFRNRESEGFETIVFDDFVLLSPQNGRTVSALD